MTAVLARPTMNHVVRAAVERAGLRRKNEPDTVHLVIPEQAWHQPVKREPKPVDEVLEEYEEDFYYLEKAKTPMSRGTATGLGGFAAALLSGVVPSLVVGPVAGLVAGVAAGVFGGLMGSSLAEEAYDRKERRDGELEMSN